MNATEQTIQDLHKQISDLTCLVGRLKEAWAINVSRIDAIENACNTQARYFPEIRVDFTALRKSIAQLGNTRKREDDKLGAAILTHDQETHAVLESHTAAIFRLETKLDRISEQFAAAGFAPLHQSPSEDVPDAEGLDPECVVDRTELVINTTAADDRDRPDPRPTTELEESPVS